MSLLHNGVYQALPELDGYVLRPSPDFSRAGFGLDKESTLVEFSQSINFVALASSGGTRLDLLPAREPEGLLTFGYDTKQS